MERNYLHIISFDIPYPPIYGGIIDVFYKIKTLSEMGYHVILHCFDYKGKEHSSILENICERVYYYPRKKAYKVFFKIVPYIVSSRSNDDLLSNLLLDNYPILFEGLHTCFYLSHPMLATRNKSVWMHNIEWDYYQNLSKSDKNFIHKIHFNVESKKLKIFESILKYAQNIFCVNKKDVEYMKQYCENSIFIPAFNLNERVTTPTGIGDYILYHGSLDVVENHTAVIWLISNVFSKIDKPVIIAGKNPKQSLVDLIKKNPHIKLRPNLEQAEMDRLIAEAQCHVLISFQDTGLKHKVLNALYKGRHVIVNSKIVANSGLEELCHIQDDPKAIIESIRSLWTQPVTQAEMTHRQSYLEWNYSNKSNVNKMIPYIFNHSAT